MITTADMEKRVHERSRNRSTDTRFAHLGVPAESARMVAFTKWRQIRRAGRAELVVGYSQLTARGHLHEHENQVHR